jgi:hypothetical protein
VAIAVGLPRSDVVERSALRRGSMREIDPGFRVATRTQPRSAMIEVGPLVIGIVAVTVPVRTSTRDTVESSAFATQRLP